MTNEQQLESLKANVLESLVKADGAILYWQLPRKAVEQLIADGEAYIADDDCLVHKDAVKIGDGAYTLKP